MHRSKPRASWQDRKGTALGSIGKVKSREVHLLYDVPDESNHVIHGDPFVHRRREEE